MSKRSCDAPPATTTIAVVRIAPGPDRKAWQIALINKCGKTLIELRLAARAPDGSVILPHRRPLLCLEILRRVIHALLAAEIDLGIAIWILKLIGRA